MSGGDWKTMFKAVQENDLELVDFYLRNGIDPNYQHPEFMASALVESIRFGHLKIAKLLLDNGANPEIKEVMGGKSPLAIAAAKKNVEAIKLIKAYL